MTITNTTNTNDTGGESDFSCGLKPPLQLVVGSLICIMGLLLNAAFVFVFLRVRYMKTLTNAYLVSLATSDMLLLLSVLVAYVMAFCGVQPSAGVNCFFQFLHTMLLFVSLWVVTIVSIERYLGICNPLKARMLNTKGRVMTLISLTWVLGITFSIPRILHCTLLQSHPDKLKIAENIIYITYVLMFLASMITVATMYTLTIKNFRQSVRMLGDRKQSKKVKSDERQVLVTCMAISVMFFICMLPACYKYAYHTIQTLSGAEKVYGDNFTVCMYALSRWLLLINSSINPLIYTITSARCRRAFYIAFSCSRQEYDYMGVLRSTTGNGTSMMTSLNTAGNTECIYKHRLPSLKELSV